MPSLARATFILLLILLSLAGGAAQAQPAFQIKDINTSAVVADPPFGRELVELAGVSYFAASDGIHGLELWRSDGTAAGTRMVKDICQGFCSSTPSRLVVLGGQVFFLAEDGDHGTALWTSDGSAAGTTLRLDREILDLKAVGGALLFISPDGGSGAEVWRSDGTVAGTTLLKDIAPGAAGSDPTFLGQAGGILFFLATDPTSGRELWTTSGMAENTALVADLSPGPAATIFGISAVSDNRIFFRAIRSTGQGLWVSDGTAAGTVQFKELGTLGEDNLHSLTGLNGGVLFVTEGESRDETLWWTDGTESGSVQLVTRTRCEFCGSLGPFPVAGSQAYFGFPVLWTTDGTVAGTHFLREIFINFSLRWFGDLNGQLVFFGLDQSLGVELWKSNGTEKGTLLVADLDPGINSFSNGGIAPLGVVGGRWLFGALPRNSWWSLWSTDATGTGTAAVGAVNVQTSSLDVQEPFASLGGTLLFPARNTQNPAFLSYELWKSDGTAFGTIPVAEEGDPFADRPEPKALTVAGSTAYFLANSFLWQTDGTEAGTTGVPASSSYSIPGRLTPLGDTLFASAHLNSSDPLTAGDWLWSTRGTGILFNVHHSPPKAMTPFAGKLLFSTEANELWQIGPTDATATPFDIHPDPIHLTNPNQLTVVGSTLFFAADDGTSGMELWKTDGTKPGTVRVKDIRPGSGSSLQVIYDRLPNGDFSVAAGGKLFFVADDGTSGRELWVSDGTTAGTVPLRDIRPGADSPEIAWLTAVGSRVYFTADDGVHGRELWTSDGTPAGTILAADILPGAGSSLPQQLAALGHVLLFSATDGVNGREPWRSSATRTGNTLFTFRLQDIAPGPLSSSPLSFTAAGDRIHFAANDNTTGFEPWGGPRRHVLSTFRDTRDHFAWQFIEALVLSGFTSGCGGGDFCPDRPVNRAEAAVFLVRGSHGLDFVPPPATGTRFQDVGSTSFAAAFIEQLAADGLTNGCSTAPPLYCPGSSLTRAEMAVFLLLAMNGPGFMPPPATGTVFTDVPAGHFAAAWIEELARAGITAGCGGGQFCPERPVTRGELAVFLTRAFNLPVP